MKVVHVLRKPCSEGTVAANVLRWGTGALNIDACRNTCAPGDEVSLHGRAATENGWDARWSNAQEAKQTAGQALGRWPANLVLQHLDGCSQEGTREVKALGATGSRSGGASGPACIEVGAAPLERRAWVSDNGTETVAAWSCAEGCPVAVLDAQSGVLKSGALPSNQYVKGARDNSSIFAGSGVFTHKGYEADVGGASRFFKQFGGDKVHGDPSDG